MDVCYLNGVNAEEIFIRNVSSIMETNGICRFLGVTRATNTVKGIGIDIEEMHGVYPIHTPLQSSTIDLEFLVYNLQINKDNYNSSSGNNQQSYFKHFISAVKTWFYNNSRDEPIKLTIDNNEYGRQYTNVQFYSANITEILSGIMGMSAKINISLTAIDGLWYNRRTTSQQVLFSDSPNIGTITNIGIETPFILRADLNANHQDFSVIINGDRIKVNILQPAIARLLIDSETMSITLAGVPYASQFEGYMLELKGGVNTFERPTDTTWTTGGIDITYRPRFL